MSSVIVNYVTAEIAGFNGRYVWQQKEYYKFSRIEFDTGYIDEYTAKDGGFCHSFMMPHGTSLVDNTTLGVFYALILVLLFNGIGTISDIFMEAIEVITSQTVIKELKDKDGTVTGTIEEVVWNPTVANLSLMALGSSAPEIMLSVLETIQYIDDTPGELGPSTIVGSAAFNLLIITAVSIYAVGETPKKIDDVGVFFVTSVFSVFAYVWMVIVLKIWTPNVVTAAEAWITLVFTFFLIGIAYSCDLCRQRAKAKAGVAESEDEDGEDETEIL